MISSHLATIRYRYDPFNDFIPGAPMVTWTEMSLAECIEELDDKLWKLQERVIALEENIKTMCQKTEETSGVKIFEEKLASDIVNAVFNRPGLSIAWSILDWNVKEEIRDEVADIIVLAMYLKD